MAHRVARPAHYQGGASFNVFSAQGSNPTSDCKVCGKGVQKLYDKSVKTYVYSLCGGPASKIQLPKDENKIGLQLLQPFVVFQIFVPSGQPLALELRVTDTTNIRRKMYFSTSFSDIKSTPLHCQIPITMINRNIWVSLSIHVANLFAHCFKGMAFRSIDTIVLGPVCKLRKIFTMRNRLADLGGVCNSFNVSEKDYLPQEHMFALGIDNTIQVLDIMALQLNISNLSNPSNGMEEDTLRPRKVNLNKLESKQVHVAFGSRMPLPLSTVQINTNLPGDNKLQSNRVFAKEREQIEYVGRNIPPQSEIPSSIPEQIRVENKVENKVETLQNLLKHANTFNKNHTMMKLKKDQTISDQGKLSTINELVERSHDIHFTTQELQLPSNLTTLNVSKQTAQHTEVGVESIMALISSNKNDTMNILPKEDQNITHLQYLNDIYSKQVPQSILLDDKALNVATFETSTNEVVIEEPPTFFQKKIEEYRLPDQGLRLGKYMRRSSHVDSDRRKEYKQTRYMDSPPESPPCGWTSCIEDDTKEKSFKIPSFFNKTSNDMDDLERSKDGIDIGLTTSNDSLHDLEDEGHCTEEACMKYLSDEDTKCDYSSENLHTEQFMKDVVGSTSKSIENFMNDGPRPTEVIHEKINLRNDDNFMFHDSKFVGTMSDEDYSFGRHSWSSNDSQCEEGHISNLFTQFSYHPSFYNDEITCNKDREQILEIDTRLSKNLHDTFQELNTSSNNDKNNNIDSSNNSLRIINKYINDDDSFEFNDTLNGDCNGNSKSSPTITQPQSRALYKDIEISTCNKDGSYGMLASSSDSMKSNNKHSISSFILKNVQENVQKEKKSNCIIECEDTISNNGQHNEDLDLLYDPTLDCYYDPKTNRYYELK